MLDLIEQNRDALSQLCREYQVRGLELFGSGAREEFDHSRSDLDFLVVFQRAGKVSSFTSGRTLEEYKTDLMLRPAVERRFEIIGEALTKLTRADATIAQRITEYRRIISFRDVRIHGYDSINDETTWRIVQDKLPILIKELDELSKAA